MTAIFHCENFESRASLFAESMLESLWENFVLDLTGADELQDAVASYNQFIDYVKTRGGAYYEALQICHHGEPLHNTPGRQLQEDFEELKKLAAQEDLAGLPEVMAAGADIWD